MNYHIKAWALERVFEHYHVQDGQLGSKTVLPNLSKINIFVGSNNSGKSRFMRKLASNAQIVFHPHFDSSDLTRDFNRQNEFRDAFVGEAQEIMKQIRASRSNLLAQFDSENRVPLEFMSENVDTHLLELQLSNVATLANVNYDHTLQQGSETARVTDLIQKRASYYKGKVNEMLKDLPKKYQFKKIYFPTLRGLRTFDGIEDKDLYYSKTHKDYFSQMQNGVIIFTGLTMYNQVLELLTGTYVERKTIAAFEEFLSQSFFEGKRITLIPSKTGVLFVKVGREKEFPIHHLGDGIQSIIILTFPLFTNSGSKLLVFYEEPELYMHPGIQRVFLEVLNSFPDYQYFLTTHSNHFLDITADAPSVSVYTFRKEFADTAKENEAEAMIDVANVSNEDHASLQLLGVRNSSVFLTNCTIWVEGITDRRYLSKYLQLYQGALPAGEKQFKEDMHFSFVEYGGSNITHWSFLDNEHDPIEVKRLCGKLMLIADKDNIDNTAKQERHIRLKAKLKERYICLQCREIENLLTPDVILQVVSEYEGGAIKLDGITQDSYNDKLLGKHIETDILKGNRKRRGSYATENGTVTDKIHFCDRALKYMSHFESLSPEAKQLSISIYAFIKLQNT